MNNVFVYCELEGTTVADVSLELLTKGRKLANQLNCQLEAIVAGSGLEGIEKQVMPFGVDKVHVFLGALGVIIVLAIVLLIIYLKKKSHKSV